MFCVPLLFRTSRGRTSVPEGWVCSCCYLACLPYSYAVPCGRYTSGPLPPCHASNEYGNPRKSVFQKLQSCVPPRELGVRRFPRVVFTRICNAYNNCGVTECWRKCRVNSILSCVHHIISSPKTTTRVPVHEPCYGIGVL